MHWLSKSEKSKKSKNGENIPKDGFFHRFFFSEIKPADGDACRFDLFI